eukprot:4099170-Alexandrium_andersonii.AAC.1
MRAPSASLSPENSACHTAWRLSRVWRVTPTVSLSARISICACSRSLDREADWAWNSDRAWLMRSPTADAALSDSA